MNEAERNKQYTNFYNAALGRKLKSWRQYRSLTQELLGDRMNMDPVQISRIERGKHRISTQTLGRFDNALDMELKTLLKHSTEEANQLIETEE